MFGHLLKFNDFTIQMKIADCGRVLVLGGNMLLFKSFQICDLRIHVSVNVCLLLVYKTTETNNYPTL